MKPINEAIKHVVQGSGLADIQATARAQTLADPGVTEFLAEHSDRLDEQLVERGIPALAEYAVQSHDCSKCPSLGACANFVQGFEPHLALGEGGISIGYSPCRRKVAADAQRAVKSMISSFHMPRNVLDATVTSLDFDAGNHAVLANRFADFLAQAERTGKLPKRGVYIYGKFGVGKSHMLGAFANNLAEAGIRSVLVYVPEFLRELKSSIADQSLNEKVEFVKEAPVLMLDDIGAEMLTPWTRDELLGTILHYRLAEERPTFFTSNFEFGSLQRHLALTKQGDQEEMKAARIVERIRALAESFELIGRNRRNPTA